MPKAPRPPGETRKFMKTGTGDGIEDEQSLASDDCAIPPPPIPDMIANWWLNEKLGSGFSGSIFRATNIHTSQEVALKVQYMHHECPTNLYERNIYPLLQGDIGLPKLYAAGVQGVWDYLAIELLGPSLDSLFRQIGKDMMDVRSVCAIAIQVINRLQFIHQREVLHRDIQLGNCAIGLPPNDKVIYMIDFGFSKRYIDKYTKQHIPDSKIKRSFVGNYWFSSVNVHCRGKVPSRRDDLEAVALMLIHLLTPRGLSWTRNGVPKTSSAHNSLKSEKRKWTPEDLCRGLPSEFEEFLVYTRRLTFKERPNYESWAERFRNLSINMGYKDVEKFIWPPPEPVAPILKTFSTPRRTIQSDEMKEFIDNLRRLKLTDKVVFDGMQHTKEGVDRQTEERAKVNSLDQQKNEAKNKTRDTVVVISSGSEGDNPLPTRSYLPKATRLNMLTKRTSNATDNATLAAIVKDFVEVMKMNSSRTMTKEAFGFLDVLYKQLDDPSVFIARTSKQASFNEQVPEKEPSHVKLGVVARLRREVWNAQSNKVLGTMIADFAKVTNKSTGRTITKDGFAFLSSLSEKLITLC